MALTYLTPDEKRKILVCIRLFRATIPGYYDNMSFVQCVRKMTNAKMWIKAGRIEWQSGAKKLLTALGFHRRDRFSSSGPTNYYLSVAIAEPPSVDPDTGQENDPDVGTGAQQIATAIRAACNAFDTDYMTPNGHPDRLYIAYHPELKPSKTRLGPVFDYAEGQGWLGSEVNVTRALANDGETIVWPDLLARKVSTH